MNDNTKIVLTALISSIITTLIIFNLPKKETQSSISQSKNFIDNEEIMQEQLSRNTSFLGEQSIQKLTSSKIIIVGLGGVGSWATVMLARAGVGKLRLIDFDMISLSSLNRHACATRMDVGTSKVDCLEKYIKLFSPSIEIDGRIELFNKDSCQELLEGDWDYVIDCIDNLDTKAYLLKYCYSNDIKVISSMGAGGKSDPTRIHISDISRTQEDPLAKAIRRVLKKDKIATGITCIYSSEKPRVKLLPLEAKEFSILPQFRVRIMPVLGTLPAIFGLSIASYLICKIAEHEMEPLFIRRRTGLYKTLLKELQYREEKLHDRVFNAHSVEYVLEEVWRGQSALSNDLDKLCLTRWNKNEPLSYQNCVVMTKAQLKQHDLIHGNVDDYYSKEILNYIKSRFEEEKRLSSFS